MAELPDFSKPAPTGPSPALAAQPAMAEAPDFSKPAAVQAQTEMPDFSKPAAATPTEVPDFSQGAPAGAPKQKKQKGLGREFVDLAARNLDDVVDYFNSAAHSPSMLGRLGYGALGVGSALAVPFTPVQFGLQETLGAGVEAATGGRISKHTTGEVATLGAMFFLDPLGGFAQAGRAIGGTKVARDIVSRLAPTAMSEGAGEMGRVIGEYGSRESTMNLQAREALKPWQGMLNRLPQAEKDAVRDRIMMGAPQLTPELGAFDKTYRELQGNTNKFLQMVGHATGQDVLKEWNDNYLGLIWEKIDPAARELEKDQRIGKRPFLGNRNFQKPKTYQTVSQARGDAQFIAEHRLATEDIVQMMLWKFEEQYRFGYGKLAEHEMKTSGLARWVPWHERPGPGVVELDDKIFNPVLAPFEATITSTHQMTQDPGLIGGLMRIADQMGFKVETPLAKQDPFLAKGGGLGYSSSDPRNYRIVSRFGNADTVLEHEVGHKLDDAFRLWEFMSMDQKAWREMGNLALLRYPNLSTQIQRAALNFIDKKYPYIQPGQNYLGYILSGKERMANFFHAYWHAPELLKKTAPTAVANFEKWMQHTGGVITAKPGGPTVAELIRGVAPSLRHSEKEIEDIQRVRGFGLQTPGRWMAEADTARIFNNFVTPSSLATPLFENIRKFGMGLNMLQLGLSAFHATFTTVDVMVSQLGRAIESAMSGHFGQAALQAASVPTSAFTTVFQGGKLRANLLSSAAARNALSQEERAVMQMYHLGGGRMVMDAFHRASEHSLIRGLKDGTLMMEVERGMADHPYKELLSLPFKIAGRAVSDMSHPVMDYLVPRQKLGVFNNLALDFVRRHPNASKTEMRKAAQKIWDSVDNRLGQMVYDNVFWTRTFKDLMFMVTRSVGWNLGTIRELGGGAADFAKAVTSLREGNQVEFTHRMAYSMAMPIVAGTIGAAMTYLYTGHGPTSYLDYFFPPTGKLTPRGAKERVIVPSYMKDLFEYDRHFFQTLKSKTNPQISMWLMLLDNRDFWGGIIRDPDASFAGQMRDLFDFGVDQLTPFSVRSARRLSKEKSSVTQQIGAFAGFQPAPAFIVDPRRGEAYQRRQDIIAKRRRAKERALQ